MYETFDPVESGFYVASNTALGFLFGGGVKIAQKSITNVFDTSHRALNLHAQTMRERNLSKEKDLPELAKRVEKNTLNKVTHN